MAEGAQQSGGAGPPMGMRGSNKVQPAETGGTSIDSSNASSLFDRVQGERPTVSTTEQAPPEKHPYLKMIRDSKEVFGVIGFLLILTFVCAYFPILRLPTCVVQTLLIGFASLKWEEDSWFATSPNRIVRLVAQVFLTIVPFVISGVLIFLCVDEYKPKPPEEIIPPEATADLLEL
mmetsp:Transcript_17145/g.33684  ORF Transcript_17145/g.33684 Transcript_17145/m.33684 type:complete len:176 (+) Transcript_17145:229-756(+)